MATRAGADPELEAMTTIAGALDKIADDDKMVARVLRTVSTLSILVRSQGMRPIG